ncbi:hypothetical protein Tco_0059891 [Tanacetum coccineum]
MDNVADLQTKAFDVSDLVLGCFYGMVPFEQQPDLSPSPSPRPSTNPSPTPNIPDSIRNILQENIKGNKTSKETSLKEEEGANKSRIKQGRRMQRRCFKANKMLKKEVSTIEKVSTDRPKLSIDGSKVSTDEQMESNDDQVDASEEIFEGTEDQRKTPKRIEVKDEDKDEESTRKRKLGTRKKMKSRKRRYIQHTSEDDSDKENDDLRLVIRHIVWRFEAVARSEQVAIGSAPGGAVAFAVIFTVRGGGIRMHPDKIKMLNGGEVLEHVIRKGEDEELSLFAFGVFDFQAYYYSGLYSHQGLGPDNGHYSAASENANSNGRVGAHPHGWYGTNALSKLSPDTELVLYPLQDKLTSRDKSLDLSAFKLSRLFFSLLSSGSSSYWRSYRVQ